MTIPAPTPSRPDNRPANAPTSAQPRAPAAGSRGGRGRLRLDQLAVGRLAVRRASDLRHRMRVGAEPEEPGGQQHQEVAVAGHGRGQAGPCDGTHRPLARPHVHQRQSIEALAPVAGRAAHRAWHDRRQGRPTATAALAPSSRRPVSTRRAPTPNMPDGPVATPASTVRPSEESRVIGRVYGPPPRPTGLPGPSGGDPGAPGPAGSVSTRCCDHPPPATVVEPLAAAPAPRREPPPCRCCRSWSPS